MEYAGYHGTWVSHRRRRRRRAFDAEGLAAAWGSIWIEPPKLVHASAAEIVMSPL